MQAPGDTVLVAGATGGVGQILTAKLLEVAIIKVPNVAFHWVLVQQSAIQVLQVSMSLASIMLPRMIHILTASCTP